MSAEPFGTWTAYPSLLSSLTHEQQVSLERAASAHYCGRYHEADDIFASDLGTLHTIPIVALQHADMLTASGRERERVDIIRAAQASLDPQAEDSASLSLLLELMLAEAEYFANGLLPETSQHAQPWLLRRVRSLFWDGGVEGLSDLQVCAVEPMTLFGTRPSLIIPHPTDSSGCNILPVCGRPQGGHEPPGRE